MAALSIIGQVFLSVLAIFGLIFLFRVTFDGSFAPSAITVAVIIRNQKDADDLDILLCEAERNLLRRRNVPVVVLVSEALLQGDIGEGGVLFSEYRELLLAHHAILYIGSEQNQPSSE